MCDELVASLVRFERMPVTRPPFVLVLVSPCTTLPAITQTPLDSEELGGLSSEMPSTVPTLVPSTFCTMHDLIVMSLWLIARMPNELGVPLPMSPAVGPPITVVPLSATPMTLPSSNWLALPASDTPA